MKYSSLLPLSVLAAVLLLASCKEKSSASSEGPMDVPTATVESGILSDGISFRVKIPSGFHAYIDSGSQGNLIPVSFFWEGAAQKEPELRSSPAGVYDEEFEAKVLRGTGIWEFTMENPESVKGKSIKVQTQVCDEKTGICYRPVFQDVMIRM